MKNHFKVSVLGAAGRMGSQIVRRIAKSSTVSLHYAVEHKGHDWIGEDCGEKLLGEENNVLITDDLNLALKGADAVIDFTTPDTSLECLKICAQVNTVHIIGTTGFDLAQENEILQIERVGFFRVDQVHSNSKNMQLFMVPDGKQKAMSTLTSKLDHV